MRTNRSRNALLVISLTLACPAVLLAEASILVTSSTQLQSAFSTVSDGGEIVVAAGTYASPASGFLISNPGKTFTVRAAEGATVVLDGGSARPVLRYESSSPASSGHVTFEDLTFRNGLSSLATRGGGITQTEGNSVFIRCVVELNHTTQAGGGFLGFNQSRSRWVDSQIRDNTAIGSGAGIHVLDNSEVWIHRTRFLRNRNNIPGHSTLAVAGGIHFFDSTGVITDSRFEDNESVWAGAGVYALGSFVEPFTTPGSDLIITNTTFVGNVLSSQPGSPPPSPGEGGGIHLENSVRMRLHHSRLIENAAQIGGGLSMLSSEAEVADTVFRGNRATDTSPTSGFGGTIKATSDDGSTTVDFPTASLTIRDSLIQGRFGATTTAARSAGGLFIGGDSARAYGIGVPQASLAASRADLLLERVAFVDLDLPGDGSAGGALAAAVTDLQASDILVTGSDAPLGGGAYLLQDTLATISDSAFVDNSATTNAGAIFASAVELDLQDNVFFANDVGSGLGASMFSEPKATNGIVPNTNVRGVVAGNLFAGDDDVSLFDSDGNAAPYNLVVYNANTFFTTLGSGKVYGHPITGALPFQMTPAQLNGFTVERADMSTTDKSPQSNNTALGGEPDVAFLLAVPSEILANGAIGDVGPTPAFVAWAATDASATLDGDPVATPSGLETADQGTHELDAGTASDTATVFAGANPGASFTASPSVIDPGQTSQLSWSLTDGTLLDISLDHGLDTQGLASGSVMVQPPCTTTYRLYLATEEGGEVVEATVFVGENPELIFADGFESGDVSAW